jgi:HAD superfamily hydrolase (TIGR01509 family)
MTIKYILWDNDGVLVETEQWFFEANKIALREIDVELTHENYMYYMQNGITVWSIPKEHGISEDTINAQKDRRNKYYQDFLISEHIEIDGVSAVLATLKNDYEMAIITTSKPEDFTLIHNDRDILAYMDFYLAKGDYERSKPQPDPYLAGMKKFGAKPSECVVVEDSARGLRSAIAAGIDCIVVRNEFTATHDFSGAKCIIDNIGELPAVLDQLNDDR